MVWFAKQKCTHPKDRLTNDESVAILLYTIEWEPCEKSFYVLLNVALRAEKRDTLRPWFSYLRLMINALQKLPAVPETTVYRGDETITCVECESGKSIQSHSFYKDEEEILLLPARQFEVVGCVDQGNGLKLVQLKETKPKFPLIKLP